jgi:hypothetical protein
MASGDYETARESFLYAARSAPSLTDAREGLLESLKAKSFLYRMSLRAGLRLATETSRGNRVSSGWIILIAMAIPSIAFKVIKTNPEAGVVLWTIVGLVYGSLILFQISDYDATLRAWVSPYRRLAMTGWDLAAAAGGSACMSLVLVGFAMYFVTGHLGAIAFSITFFLLAIPVETAFKAPPVLPRALLLSVLMVLLLLGVISHAIALQTTEGREISEKLPPILGWMWVALLGGVWLFDPLAKVIRRFGIEPSPFFDPTTFATQPGGIGLSDAKMRRFHPELYGLTGLFHARRFPGRGVSAHEARQMIHEHLRRGDSQPALVVSTRPLVVAAYTEDIDCVALLEFDEALALEHRLQQGSRLLTVNTYLDDAAGAHDLQPGPDRCGPWKNFWPCIAEFLSDDVEQIAQRKRDIAQNAWLKAARAAKRATQDGRTQPVRSGHPLLCHVAPREPRSPRS